MRAKRYPAINKIVLDVLFFFILSLERTDDKRKEEPFSVYWNMEKTPMCLPKDMVCCIIRQIVFADRCILSHRRKFAPAHLENSGCRWKSSHAHIFERNMQVWEWRYPEEPGRKRREDLHAAKPRDRKADGFCKGNGEKDSGISG